MEFRSIRPSRPLVLTLAAVGVLAFCSGCGEADNAQAQAAPPPAQDAIHAYADQLIDEGRQTFRSDTFGDQAFWGDTIKLHQAIAGSAHGGVGPGVSPRTALSVGLKVDSEALPSDVQAQIKNGTANLDDPATTNKPRRAVRRYSAARAVAPPVTCRRCSPSRGGTCTRQRK